MITRLKVRGYKSLRDTEVHLGKLNLVAGPNAAGKSNLFDLLGLVARLTQGIPLDEALKPPLHRGDPKEAFSLPHKNRTLKFSVEIDVNLQESIVRRINLLIQEMKKGAKNRVSEKRLRYYLEIGMDSTTGHLFIAGERVSVLNRTGEEKSERRRKPFLSTDEKVSDRLVLRMEGQAHPRYYDLGTNKTVLSESLYLPQYPHMTALREELSSMSFYYLEPSVMREESPFKESLVLGLSGAELASFYNTIRNKEPRRFKTIVKTLRTLVPTIEEMEVMVTEQGRLLLRIKEGNEWFTSRVISEGTLRILALLAITNSLKPLSLVGYEEPENGVHPRRLREVAGIFEAVLQSEDSPQFIINTHSPEFLDCFNYGESVRLIYCVKKSEGTIFRALLGPEAHRGLYKSPILKAIADGEPISRFIGRGDFD
ncbi:MAG: AAA family ATPase [candidate division WOR-3 bacterium]